MSSMWGKNDMIRVLGGSILREQLYIYYLLACLSRWALLRLKPIAAHASVVLPFLLPLINGSCRRRCTCRILSLCKYEWLLFKPKHCTVNPATTNKGSWAPRHYVRILRYSLHVAWLQWDWILKTPSWVCRGLSVWWPDDGLRCWWLDGSWVICKLHHTLKHGCLHAQICT